VSVYLCCVYALCVRVVVVRQARSDGSVELQEQAASFFLFVLQEEILLDWMLSCGGGEKERAREQQGDASCCCSNLFVSNDCVSLEGVRLC